MSMDERFLDTPIPIPDTYDRDQRRKADEHALLLGVAKLLAELVLWKNINGRSDALTLLELVKRIEGGSTPTSGVPERRPLGCALAMRVLQSDLYKQLDDAERADCDELVHRNLEWVKAADGVDTAPPTETKGGA